MYNVDGYIGKQATNKTICYCRVSSRKQSDDLERQVGRMRELYPDAEIITDIGGGLNFKRKGLRSLLERVLRGDKLKIVVANRDRIARFGFDLFKYIIEQSGGELLVQHEAVGDENGEFCEDILAIIHHFSCRMHGKRGHANSQNKGVSDKRTREIVQELVSGESVRL
jgi:predicted site-specific integrase-resolvase